MRYVPFTTTGAETSRRMDELRFKFGKWDLHVDGRNTVSHGALVLSRREHQEATAAAEAIYAASLATQHRIHRNPEIGASLGLDSAASSLAQAHKPGPFVTRVDLFKTAEGWKASECNDDVPGGYNEAIGLPALFHDALPEGLTVPGDLPDALVRFAAPGGRVGLVYATGYSEDLQVMEFVARMMQAEGIEVVLSSPSHLEFAGGETTLLGQGVDRIFRFFPSEWFRGLLNLQAWQEALASGLSVTNPFSTAYTQSKASFGKLAEGGTAASDHIPETRPLDEESRVVLLADQHDWVLKPSFGRMGAGVVLGDLTTREEWRKRVYAAWRDRASRPFVMQRRFHPVPVELEPGVTATPCIGAYVIDGRFAGYYSRLARGNLVAYDATNILTVVEGL